MTTPTWKAAYVYDDVLSGHVLREGHPMRPVRLRHTYAPFAAGVLRRGPPSRNPA